MTLHFVADVLVIRKEGEAVVVRSIVVAEDTAIGFIHVMKAVAPPLWEVAGCHYFEMHIQTTVSWESQPQRQDANRSILRSKELRGLLQRPRRRLQRDRLRAPGSSQRPNLAGSSWDGVTTLAYTSEHVAKASPEEQLAVVA